MAATAATVRLQSNFNDDNGPKNMWAGRYWHLRRIMQRQAQLRREAEGVLKAEMVTAL